MRNTLIIIVLCAVLSIPAPHNQPRHRVPNRTTETATIYRRDLVQGKPITALYINQEGEKNNAEL